MCSWLANLIIGKVLSQGLHKPLCSILTEQCGQKVAHSWVKGAKRLIKQQQARLGG